MAEFGSQVKENGKPPDISRALVQEIDSQSIKLIAAGEKINDIETAIRELVENSIDADAKNIEVRLAKFGIDSIEVEDNGTGINQEDFKCLGMRYHTSKICDYEKLQEDLETFGFRGEALSCLCNIASVTITTKSKSSPTGWKLSFEKDGILGRIEPIGRDEGTTVILKNLFNSFPVRRRELEKSAKKQYDKIVKLLYEQVLARPHIKFTLCKKNGTKKDKDFTHGGTTLKGCLTTIFGIKLFETLMPIKQFIQGELVPNPSEASQTVTSQHRDEFFKRSCRSKFARRKPEYTVHGYISKIGCGRNSTDGQFIFVNKKPCDIQKISRTINEIYRNHNNNNQYPFYCIFIQVQPWAADFNVPRKRAVILQDENNLCAIVRESLETMYSSLVPASQKSCSVAQIPSATPFKNECDKTNSDLLTHSNKRAHSPSSSSGFQSAKKLLSEEATESYDTGLPTPDLNSGKESADLNCGGKRIPTSNSELNPYCGVEPGSTRRLESDNDNSNTISIKEFKDPFAPKLSPDLSKKTNSATKKANVTPSNKPKQSENCRFNQINVKVNGILQTSLQFTEDLGLAFERERAQRKLNSDEKQFSFAIHPTFNAPAEEELKFQLDKKSFLEMQVIGQFNNGFIIARLNKHLFIIDQHATDERANYEEQLENSPLVKQPMVFPKPLYLNLLQENAILNNIQSFVDRGFEFTVDKSKLIGFRVMLSSTSICKGPTKDEYLGKEDIEELIDVATESPNRLETYILSKVRNVSASVACRKSVMIGDSLTWQQMTCIVEKMSGLKNPWVCAHNRPTIRHLMDTDWVSNK